jgi:predicted ArsR family transcriptional regulator
MVFNPLFDENITDRMPHRRAERRRAEILDYLDEVGAAHVEGIAADLNRRRGAVNRDLAVLEREGRIASARNDSSPPRRIYRAVETETS